MRGSILMRTVPVRASSVSIAPQLEGINKSYWHCFELLLHLSFITHAVPLIAKWIARSCFRKGLANCYIVLPRSRSNVVPHGLILVPSE